MASGPAASGKEVSCARFRRTGPAWVSCSRISPGCRSA